MTRNIYKSIPIDEDVMRRAEVIEQIKDIIRRVAPAAKKDIVRFASKK